MIFLIQSSTEVQIGLRARRSVCPPEVKASLALFKRMWQPYFGCHQFNTVYGNTSQKYSIKFIVFIFLVMFKFGMLEKCRTWMFQLQLYLILLSPIIVCQMLATCGNIGRCDMTVVPIADKEISVMLFDDLFCWFLFALEHDLNWRKFCECRLCMQLPSKQYEEDTNFVALVVIGVKPNNPVTWRPLATTSLYQIKILL